MLAKVSPPAQEDLSLDADQHPSRKKIKAGLAELPELLQLEMPPINGGDPVNVRVATGHGKDVLWVELSSATINYLADYTAAQSHDDEPAPAQDADRRYISYDEVRKAHRVRFKGTSRWFSKQGHDDPLKAAECFLERLRDHGPPVAEADGDEDEGADSQEPEQADANSSEAVEVSVSGSELTDSI